MKNAVIVYAKRTAIGKFGGVFSKVASTDLGASLVRNAANALGEKLSREVDDIIIGQVLTAGCGQSPAKQTALKGGLTASTRALTINRVCGSGLKAVALAQKSIAFGDSKIVFAGGQENMTLAPHLLPQSRAGYKYGSVMMLDHMAYDGLTNPYDGKAMGYFADNCAKEYNLSRKVQDDFAEQSYLKAQKFYEIPVFISVILLIPVIIIEYRDSEFIEYANYVNWGIWIVFLLEYTHLLFLSENKKEYILNHKLELFIVVVSIPFVPQGFESSRFLRFIRLPRLLRLFQLFRLAAVLAKFGTAIKTIFNSKGLRFIVYATIFLIIFFGFLFYVSEPEVKTYGDGIWWALVTITTVGYGDITPYTTLGRIVASTLMVLGIGFIATLTAAVSAYFLSNFGDKETTLEDVLDKLEKIDKELDELRESRNE